MVGQRNKRGRITRAAILSLGRPSREKKTRNIEEKGSSPTNTKKYPSFVFHQLFCGGL